MVLKKKILPKIYIQENYLLEINVKWKVKAFQVNKKWENLMSADVFYKK